MSKILSIIQFGFQFNWYFLHCLETEQLIKKVGLQKMTVEVSVMVSPCRQNTTSSTLNPRQFPVWWEEGAYLTFDAFFSQGVGLFQFREDLTATGYARHPAVDFLEATRTDTGHLFAELSTLPGWTDLRTLCLVADANWRWWRFDCLCCHQGDQEVMILQSSTLTQPC